MPPIPEFELSLWNAWILILSYLLMYIVLGGYVRLKGPNGASRPITPPRALQKRKKGLQLLGSLCREFLSFFGVFDNA